METKPNNAAVIDQQSDVVVEPIVPTNLEVDISQGVPVAPDHAVASAESAEKAPETPADEQTPPDGTETPVKEEPSSEATVERLRQKLAQSNKLIASLGMDPMSDLAQQLENGEITPEMLQEHIAGKIKPIPEQEVITPQKDAIAMAEEALVSAEQKYNDEAASGEGVSIKTNDERYQASKVLNDAKLAKVTDRIAADDVARQGNESLETVLSVARSTTGFADMEKPLQADIEQVSIGVTGFLANHKAKADGFDPDNLSQMQFKKYATQANEMLGRLAEHYLEAGRVEARIALNPNPPVIPVVNNANKLNTVPGLIKQPVNPVGPSGDAIPVANQFVNTTSYNHAEMAKQYVAGGQQM